MLFRPRIPGLHALDREGVQAWSKLPESALGEGLSAEARRSLAGLLVHVWEMENPAHSWVEDAADLPVVDWLPEFVPAPSYVWARARHPESNVLFWWTLASPVAEREETFDPDPYASIAGVTIEETEDAITLDCDNGAFDGATITIRRHAIELLGMDEDPVYFIRAIIAFTGWASARDNRWGEWDRATEFLLGDVLTCVHCNEPYESGLRHEAPCQRCGLAVQHPRERKRHTRGE